MTTDSDLILRLKQANRWRSAYNPLRGLTVQKSVKMLEDGERGMYADLQWTYRLIEKRWATLKALRSRRLSALGKLDWSIKTVDDSPAATAQADALRAAYGAIKNLRQAIRFLALASFRGYAHLEKVRENEDASQPVTELRVVDQWFWCRDGVYGVWQYNPDAKAVIIGMPVDLTKFIIREVEDPINEIALIAFLRNNLSQKDWDGFVETFGIPPMFVELPPNTDPSKQTEYQEMAEAIVADMRGTLPSGASVKTIDAGARGENPFEQHIKYQDGQLVLAGTGGKLTMLSEPTGIGSGASGAHESAFDEIAQDEATDISELLQKQFDQDILTAKFPGQPVLAYFELCAEDEESLDALCDRVLKLSQAGFQLDPSELSEKFALKIARAATPQLAVPEYAGSPGGAAPAPAATVEGNIAADPAVTNREKPADQVDPKFRSAALREAADAFQKDRAPVAERIEAILALPDDKINAALERLKKDIQGGALAAAVLKSPAAQAALQKILGTAVVAGAAAGATARESKK